MSRPAIAVRAATVQRTLLRAFASCATFNGTDDVVTLASPAGYNFEYTQPLSVAAWVFWQGPTATSGVLLGRRQSSGSLVGWEALFTTSGQLVFIRCKDTTTARMQTSTVNKFAGRWFHLVVTSDGSGTTAGVTFYADRVVQAKAAGTDTLGTNSTLVSSVNASIGARSGPAGFFKGRLAEVQLYTKVLSQDEVDTLFYTGQTASSLVGYWTGATGAGSAVPDSSGSGHGGTWTGTGGHWSAATVPLVTRSAVARGALPPVPLFPTVDPTTGLIFQNVRQVGLTPSGANTGVNRVGHQQWGDYIPSGRSATKPHGYFLLYPWGEPNNVAAHGTADVPYGMLLVHAKTADVPSDAARTAAWNDTANWSCYELPAICAADPNAANMVFVGGGRLDSATTPKYAYCGLYRKAPIPPDLVAGNNPVAIRIDVTADLSTAAAYKTYDVVANLTGLTLAKLGGQFCAGVAGGRMWWSPTNCKEASVRGAADRVVISVDVESGGSNNFQDPTKWHWVDLQPILGNTFGGFQGATTDGRYVWHCQQYDGFKMWQLDTSGPTGTTLDGTGRADVAANAANWKGIDPTTIHAGANGYLNAGVVKDPATGTNRWVVFAPFVAAQAGYTYTNRIALCYDMTNPAGGDFSNVNNWQWLDTSTIAIADANSVDTIGYQGVVQDNAGYMWLVASDYNEVNATPPWVCWNPLYPFGDPAAWNSYPSYTVYGDSDHTQPIFACGSGPFDPTTNTLVPVCWGLGLVGGITHYVATALTPSVPVNGPGVPPH